MTTAITTLHELRDALRAATPDDPHGLPTAHGEIDWTSLPTFGGAEPASTNGVYSWDATHLLVGTCAADLRIVARDEA